jgi:hypothetical protein
MDRRRRLSWLSRALGQKDDRSTMTHFFSPKESIERESEAH